MTRDFESATPRNDRNRSLNSDARRSNETRKHRGGTFPVRLISADSFNDFAAGRREIPVGRKTSGVPKRSEARSGSNVPRNEVDVRRGD